MRQNKRLSMISMAVSAALIIFSENASAISDAEAKQLATRAYEGDATSLQTLRQAAMSGDVVSEDWYGVYFNAKEDYAQALSWLRQAADQGNADAQLNLGYLYDKGRGVPQNYSQAASWYIKAAIQGNAQAQSNMGVLCENGYGGVPQDYDSALSWLRQAADQGNASGQNNLGALYENGYGVRKNYSIAYALYNLASNNNTTASSNRDKLINDMSPEQIAVGQSLTQEMSSRGVTKTIDMITHY